MATNFIGVLLPNTPSYIVGTGFSTQLYDATGAHTITVEPGASLQLTGSLGNNLLRLPGKTSAWQVYRDGSTVVLTSTDSSRIELPATRDVQTLQFDDGNRALQIDISSGSPVLKLGTQTLTAQAAAIAAVDTTPPTDPDPGEGSTTKAPWTLLTSRLSDYGTNEMLISDGSAAGTDTKIISGGSYNSLQFKINTDQTGAYFYTPTGFYSNSGMVGYTDGTLAGTQAIVTPPSVPTDFLSIVNNQLVMAGSTKAYAINGPQKTYTSTDLYYSFSYGLQDEANQTVWSSGYSSPYGQELAKLDYSNPSQITSVIVKDINPGSAYGVDSFYYQSVILPNGKLVFRANDGINGTEAWVSDGTETGTLMLKDYDQGNYGDFYGFKSYGDKVAFVARAYNSAEGIDAGTELAFTDGTREGTTLLDINPGLESSNPNILGEANGLLYFTADARDPNSGNTQRGIYSTNGTTFTKLATIQSDASLLGWDSKQAFFRVSDATHGSELWVANFSTNTFSLVKDILAGSGSALADSYGAQLAAGKLIFTAYTSGTKQGFFVSDGTSAGTVQVGNGAPTQSKVIGNTLVFANAEGVFSVNLAAAQPAAVQLSSVGLSTTSSTPLQTDADQIFYLTSSGDLFSTTGATAPTAPLARQVSQFKVVAEDAVFFIQNNSANNTQSLWYSDGTATGTRFIEDLPTNSAFDLSNAVAIRTAGEPLPPDTVAPLFRNARVNGDQLTLHFSDAGALDATHLPEANAFTLGGTSATVSSVAVDAAAKTVTLTLSEAVKSTDSVTVSYTDPTTGNDAAAIQDAAGNDAASFSNRFVTNQTPDDVAPVFGSASVNGATLTLTYTDASLLDATNKPAATAFTLDGTTATVSSVAIDAAAKTVTLTLSEAVKSTETVTVSYTDPTAGNDTAAIQDALGNDAASLVNQAASNLTPAEQVKAPWTLVASANNYLYRSDGTEAGTDVLNSMLNNAYFYGHRLFATPDKKAAVLQSDIYSWTTQLHTQEIYRTDGTATGTERLATNISYYSNQLIVGNNLVFGDYNDSRYNGLITDGTIAGTKVVTDLPLVSVDKKNQTMWADISTAPYGTELFRIDLKASSPGYSMVKDINPGSSSGIDGVNSYSALLPNGKIIFRGNDGTNGYEAWVSDGTDAGTLMLKNYYQGNGGNVYGFKTYGNKVAFVALPYNPDEAIPSAGNELAFTDGTSEGTTLLDINPGWYSSYPNILGEANGLLYFTADVTDSNVTTKGIFSTNGTTFTKLATIQSDASLLGWDTNKAFFRVSDAQNGSELWAADFAKNSFGLVKDILTGSGSALAGDTQAFMVGGKLVFKAYTSATQQNLFVSDGTAAGTTQVGSTLGAYHTLGDTLVFADGGQVRGMDLSAATPSPVGLVTGDSALAKLQFDADQVFFTLANGDLYATQGTVATTVKLASNVSNFKVVEENALYWVQSSQQSTTGYKLGYSDGTAAGTRVIEDAPAPIVQALDNAVAIQTVGVAPL